MEGSTGRQRVPENVLLDLPFPDISYSDQSTIANVLAMIQTISRLNKKKQMIAEDLFKTLLHKLMVGEIRVANSTSLHSKNPPLSSGLLHE